MIKAIFTDIDGTLYMNENTGHVFSEEDYKAILKLKSNGIKVYSITGRSMPDMRNLFDSKLEKRHWDVFDAHIFSNGSVILEDAELSIHKEFKVEDILELFKYKVDNKDIYSFNIADEKIIDNIKENNIILEKYNRISYISFSFIHSTDRSFFEKIYNDIKDKFNDYSVIEASNDEFLFIDILVNDDVSNEAVNKATAIKKFQKKHGYRDDEIFVIGDGTNDIPMFEYFENSALIYRKQDNLKKYTKFHISEWNELIRLLLNDKEH